MPPAKVLKRGPKWRVVESQTNLLVRNRYGTPVDGKGHATRAAAQYQAIAINLARWRATSKSKKLLDVRG